MGDYMITTQSRA